VAKIIISRKAQVLQEFQLSPGRITIGRHAGNDVVIEHSGVSSQHAVITCGVGEVILEDLGSTNGTFVNGQRIVRHQLADRDLVMVAKFQIDYLADAAPPEPPAALAPAGIVVLNGANAGKTLTLAKPITTLGSPGVLVVVVSRQADGYVVTRVEGEAQALVNGAAIGKEPRLLRDGDELELTGTRMRFTESGKL
jgi:hypothetical protein